MSYIYLVTNKINGKQYVGQHRYSGKGLDPKYKGSGHALWRAYEKYGIENFTMELLEECTDEDLNPLEQLYIEHYDTLHPNGYNLTEGGGGCKASEETRKKISILMTNNPKKSTPINQYNDNGDLVKTYPSIKEAARQLGCDVHFIREVLRGNWKQYKCHRFRYANECGDKIEPYKNKRPNQKQINQYSLDGVYIKTWDSMMDIERGLGYLNGGISSCCKGKCKSAYGFIWKYADECCGTDNIAPYQPKRAA